MGKTTSATRVALAPAFVPCENNRNVTFWSERAWVRTPPESHQRLTVQLLLISRDYAHALSFLARITGRSCLDGATAHHAASPGAVGWSGFWTCARGSGTGRRRRTSRLDMLEAHDYCTSYYLFHLSHSHTR